MPFFELLSQRCPAGLSLFAGSPRPDEGIHTVNSLHIGNYSHAENLHLLGGSFYLCYQRGLIEWLAAWQPNALIVEANPRYLSTPAAINWMHARDRVVVGWGLGSPSIKGLAPRYRQARRLAFLNQFDALIAYSRRGAEEYARLGYPKEKIFVAYNAVRPAPVHLLPERASKPSDKLTILFVGRLQARKRLDLLLKACAELEGKPRLVIVGDGPERRSLENLASAIYPSAVFAGDRRADLLKPYLFEADLFVLPGTGGLAVQEAMSYGLPVIVARGDGSQDDLVRAGNGWQVPPEDLTALTSYLRESLADAGRLRRMGAESYRIVAEEINIGKMADVFVQVLNQTTRTGS